MFNCYAKFKQIKVNDNIIETTDRYIYLGQLVKPDYSHLEEVKKRTQTEWSAFGKLNDSMKSNMPICLKRVFDQCILPSMTYDAGTWSMEKKWKTNLEQHKEA